ncbi:LysR substrate-binding domain-containing protein [Brevundimonas lenta]|uniref:LysR family glycine cleavage system transcriptional activator n=1 Tax=Brevundimonas lenta TaxID=424796 RepID=A0A7W6NQ33_9CAUL|nr:LysR substrate-binding domain-containing protein [Brevundimonas lenta]MBB4084075.1 LysR family glycine cleavage system transcriptional activator [Brevundimonas lenta]
MADPLAGIPLASIRVFEAAARLKSFTRAAEELGMTQAAVSWQIKALEGRLGQSLFRRLPREVQPTEAGERLSRAATEAMTLLRRAVSDLTEADEHILSITTLATLATQWMAPRLGAFQVANPGLAVRLDTNPNLLDLSREGFDVGIRSGHGDWPGMESQLLMPSVFTPLCSPAMAQRLNLKEPRDLLQAPRIGMEKEWAAWFAAAGLTGGGHPATKLTADYQVLEVAAALGDQGVALASPILFAREIAAGMLVRPFRQTVSFHTGYYLVWPEGRRRSPKIKRFRDWLVAQTDADPAIVEARAET